MVELRQGWGKPVIARVSERPLPDGVLRPSATEPNILDREIVEKELQALLQHTSERTVAICLSDQACHLAVFPFETVPPRERDREPILRWRFQHEEHVTVGNARILHRVFPVKGVMATMQPGEKPAGQVTAYVLAMAIKQTILDQYEQVCREAGVLPIAISCAALWLFDFYRPAITQPDELFFVHQASGSMTFIAIRQGLPVFCRMKVQRHRQADVMSEILSTVQFYEDLHPSGGTGAESRSIPIYMVGEGFSQKGDIANQVVEVEYSNIRKQTSFTYKKILPDWKTLISTKDETISSEEGLYALACAVGR
jgi:hypothetical protein